MGSKNNKTEHNIGEVFQWLKSLPLAPEYHPTIQEFQDPISFICKIEKVASNFGICKIVPPVSGQSKKTLISNLCNSVGLRNPRLGPTFATRVQEVGFNARNQRPVERNVWESGEECSFHEFESRAKGFEKKWLKKGKKVISPLEVETLFWKVNGGSPFLVEYVSDVVGSCFSTLKERKTGEVVLEGGCLGDSGWNMRGVARANGSLLRFMKEDIDGVSCPMVYLAMLFSWFGWHVEDHDLHSLNYLHFGASKTWYSVPSDAVAAFEEVVRVHGFGEEINPLVTFAKLGEKTTVMSPEVLINTGVPCCRLVQNAGEFVVTFPRAYHCGFSHGFNCAEASNIATPEWLRFAKDAAIRRASINYPPIVSHFQLLYDFAVALCSRDSTGTGNEPRSSRLKDKKKGEGETLVKQMFVEDVMKNNELLFTLGQGSDVVLLPRDLSEKFIWSNMRVGSKYKVKSGSPFSLCSSEEAIKASDDLMLARDVNHPRSSNSFKRKSTSVSQNSAMPSQSSSDIQHSDTEKEGCEPGNALSNRGAFSCVKCGILTFACVAIVQPTESAAHYLMSADCSFLQELAAGPGVSSQGVDLTDANHSDPDTFSGSSKKNAHDLDYEVQSIDDSPVKSATAKPINMDSYDEKSSALGLLAMAYGISSDSDELDELLDRPVDDYESGDDSSNERFHHDGSVSPSFQQGYDSETKETRRVSSDDSEHEAQDYSAKFTEEDTMTSYQVYSPMDDENDTGKISNGNDPVDKQNFPFYHGCDEDSSRMHVFCLEHAVEVEKTLRPIGGVHILLLCHPDYPKVQIEAKKVAEELKMDHVWNDIAFSEATKDDEEHILLAVQSEEATPKNEDWAVKLGINLFYCAILSRSPLYNKQMPYNSVIYSAFGCNSPSKSSPESVARGKVVGRQKKIVVAGKWCGKVWMSNQVHPLLVQRDLDVEERNVYYCSNLDEKSGTKTETKKAQTSSARQKIPRKRKPTQFKAVKKMRLETEEFARSDHDDSAEDKPAFVPRRSMRKTKSVYRRTKEDNHQEEITGVESEDDSLDDKPIQGPLRSATGKRAQLMKGQSSGSMDGSSDDSLDDLSRIEQRTSRRTLRVMGKPTRKLKSQKEEIVDSESEGSSDDEFEENGARTRSLRLEVGTSEWRVPREFEPVSDDEVEGRFSTRLRNRRVRSLRESETKSPVKRQVRNTKAQKALPSMKNGPARKGPKMRLPMRTPAITEPVREYYDSSDDNQEKEAEFRCNIEGCNMMLDTEEDFAMHKNNICHVKGCGKKFFSHKYMVPHQRVHVDDRPLKCPWKGCKMSFKWAWARTEHIRVHTGARPYVCKEPGCGQTFRFVSDFSRHKRKTGHSVNKAKK